MLAAILGTYALQSTSAGPRAVAFQLGFAPVRLERTVGQGGWSGLVTALFVHASWGHALMNAVGALAFGTPVARRLGGGLRGVVAFFGFYLACGVLASLGYALVHLGSAEVLIGASGAVSGLMGAASRLLGRADGSFAPFRSATVLGMAAAWLVINLLLAVFGSALAGISVGAGGAPVAWEAHLAGYAVGALIIAPLAALVQPRADLKRRG